MSDKRTQADGTLVAAELLVRRDAVAAARTTMRACGVTWSQVRAWARQNDWKAADVPPNTINPLAVDAYARGLPERHPEP